MKNLSLFTLDCVINSDLKTFKKLTARALKIFRIIFKVSVKRINTFKKSSNKLFINHYYSTLMIIMEQEYGSGASLGTNPNSAAILLYRCIVERHQNDFGVYINWLNYFKPIDKTFKK